MNNIITIQIKNWKHYQHYKNRKPPWIKLHRELLDNQEWRNLSPEASKLLIDLWLVAAERGTDGKVEITLNKLLWCLRYASNMLASILSWLQEIKRQEFIDFDDSLLASCLQHATPEERREEYSETETEDDVSKSNKRFIPPTIQEVQKYIKEKKYKMNAEEFIDFYTSKGWMIGKNKMKDWRAAARNWERKIKKDKKQSESEIPWGN